MAKTPFAVAMKNGAMEVLREIKKSMELKQKKQVRACGQIQSRGDGGQMHT